MDDRYHQRIDVQRLPVGGCQRESLSLQRPERRQSKGLEFNCYNPLVITTDWTLTSEFGIAIGLSTAPPDTFTNSSCSNSGSVASANVTGYDIFGF
jgi:hypothetical protein